MTTVGQIEKKTQARVVALFRATLGYTYLGDWTDRPNNRNIEPDLLRAWLKRQQYAPALIDKALRELDQAANDAGKSLYDRNRAVYTLLRYGVKVRAEAGENTQTIFLIDWKNPLKNDFAIAEEVTIKATDAKAHAKRPDVVLYVNGVALGVLELKRSTVAVAEGIRQNLDNQRKEFIQPFFSTLQVVMAGNDTEGLRYGTIEDIYRTRSGPDLIATLDAITPWLVCSLIHKFGVKEADDPASVVDFITAIRKLPPDFKPIGDLYVFVDECHRTQSGELHQAMKAILPHALFVGFTGTPLLKADKQADELTDRILELVKNQNEY
ncbi:MAG: type I restriction endonuclease [Candidatus Competibacter sp.]|nr:type I restriction endonuclease [Candidatus Competibacter sp.]